MPTSSLLALFPIRFAFITPSSMNYENDYQSFPIIVDLYLQLLFLSSFCSGMQEGNLIFVDRLFE